MRTALCPTAAVREGHRRNKRTGEHADVGTDILYNDALSSSLAMSACDRVVRQFDSEMFFNAMRINVLGGVLASSIALPHVPSQDSGSIIFTASTCSLDRDMTACSHGPSKAALSWSVRSIAATFGRQRIRYSAILPSVIQTPSQKAWSNPIMDNALLDIPNVPRLGLPDDLAAAALYPEADDAVRFRGAGILKKS